MKEYLVTSRNIFGKPTRIIAWFNDSKDIKVFYPNAVTAYDLKDKITYNLEATNA